MLPSASNHRHRVEAHNIDTICKTAWKEKEKDGGLGREKAHKTMEIC
jgi:hypothetical protein